MYSFSSFQRELQISQAVSPAQTFLLLVFIARTVSTTPPLRCWDLVLYARFMYTLKLSNCDSFKPLRIQTTQGHWPHEPCDEIFGLYSPVLQFSSNATFAIHLKPSLCRLICPICTSSVIVLLLNLFKGLSTSKYIVCSTQTTYDLKNLPSVRGLRLFFAVAVRKALQSRSTAFCISIDRFYSCVVCVRFVKIVSDDKYAIAVSFTPSVRE